MKSLNLVLAFVACSTVAMASSETPAPAATTSWSDTLNGLVDSAKGYAGVAYDYTLGYVDAADAVVVAKAQEYVATPAINKVVTPVVEFVKPATDKAVEYATLAKDFTCDAVAYPLSHPLKSMIAVAAAYAVYCAYESYNEAATKKSKN